MIFPQYLKVILKYNMLWISSLLHHWFYTSQVKHKLWTFIYVDLRIFYKKTTKLSKVVSKINFIEFIMQTQVD